MQRTRDLFPDKNLVGQLLVEDSNGRAARRQIWRGQHVIKHDGAASMAHGKAPNDRQLFLKGGKSARGGVRQTRILGSGTKKADRHLLGFGIHVPADQDPGLGLMIEQAIDRQAHFQRLANLLLRRQEEPHGPAIGRTVLHR